jgi:D-lactate dehydrogenase
MIVLFYETERAEEEYLRERLADFTLEFRPGALLNPQQVIGGSTGSPEVLSVFVKSRVSPEIMEGIPSLRMIATRSTGFDHIDLTSASGSGVVVSNVPTYGENTVAEHTFALILALSRNLHKAYVRTSAGNFSLAGLEGFDLKGKTIGVVGAGHIGLHVIRIAIGFGMKVLAFDPYPNPTFADLLGYEYTSLEELLNGSDIVTLHAPLTPQTHHMIGAHNIGQFKRGALLINTARGALVDTEVLIRALDDGILSGAGLDVLEGEEILSEEKQLLARPDATPEGLKTTLMNLMLMRRPDMVITPHIGFDSREAKQRILDTTIENIRAFAAGSPRNVVAPG